MTRVSIYYNMADSFTVAHVDYHGYAHHVLPSLSRAQVCSSDHPACRSHASPRFPASPSSSCASDDDDNDDDDDDEEEEESGESYCSSEEADDCDPRTYSADTYASRMKRILAWRDNFSVQMMSTALSGAQL